MTKAIVDRKELRFVVEGSYGAGAAAAAMQDLRFVSENLKGTQETRESLEVRSDRQVTDLKRTNIGVTGSIEGEFTYTTYDVLMQYALFSAGWSSQVTITSVILAADDGDNSINDSTATYGATASLAITTNDTITRDGGSFITEGFRVGMVVTMSSSEDAGNDGDHIITVIAALVMTIGAAGLVDNAADTAMNIDNAGGFLTDGFATGQWIKIAGFTGTTANNGIAKISLAAAAKLTLTHHTLVTDAEGEEVTLTQEPQIVNGVALESISVEREYTDLAKFVEFQGVVIDTLRFSVSEKDVVMIGFDVLGQIESSEAATVGDGAPTAVNTLEAFSTQENVTAVYENGSSISITGFELTVANGMKVRDNVIATLGPVDANGGKCRVSGSVEAYYEDSTIYDKFLDFTDTSLAIKMTDVAGNIVILEVIDINYSDGERSGGGTEEDIKMITPFIAKRDSTEDATVRIVRFPFA